MSEPRPVSVTILGKDYAVACREDEEASLFDAVSLLNEKIKQVRTSGKVVGNERIVVMAALNIVHEHLEYRQQGNFDKESVKRIQDKITGALKYKIQAPELR